MCEGPNFNFAPQYLHKKNEKLSSNQNLYMSGHSSLIHHSQRVGNLNVYQLSGKTKYNMSIQWNIIY